MEERPSEASLMSDSEDEDSLLASSKILTRQEVLKRRVRRLKRLSKCYRDYYWLLMEELRQKHREYYWFYGKGPFVEESEADDEVEEGKNGNLHSNCDTKVGNDDKLGSVYSGSVNWCVYPTCKGKAMALTSYCILHIVLDKKQMLYKGCKYPLQRVGGGEYGSLICGRAILKSVSPSVCPAHAGQAKKEISQALKKGGVTGSLCKKVSSKFNFHLVISEYVHRIQSRRRAIASSNTNGIALNNGYN
ncbi:INO80 complex subunit D [Bienertia sinuspersici]